MWEKKLYLLLKKQSQNSGIFVVWVIFHAGLVKVTLHFCFNLKRLKICIFQVLLTCRFEKKIEQVFTEKFQKWPLYSPLLLLSNLHSHLHNICFVNVFDSYIPVVLKTFTFKFFVSFQTQTVFYRSLRVLQLHLHLSKLIANG